MHKISALILFFALAMPAAAEMPDVKATLIDHVMAVTQIQDGKTTAALMDSIVQIGSTKGESVFDLQAGISGATKPEAGEPGGMNFLAGGFFKVSALLKDRVAWREHWKFLNALEHGIAYHYDFREKRDFVSYQVGLAFALNPK